MGISTSTTADPGYSQGVVGVTENMGLPGNGSIGVQGLANTGTGVKGESQTGFGVIGVTQNGVGQLGAFGVEGVANTGTGIAGFSNSGTGAYGASATGIGMVGLSKATSSFQQGVIGLTENLSIPGPAGIGVQGVASTGTGVQGTSSTGIGVLGLAWLNAACKPIVARGWVSQTASLQEWQDVFGNPLSVVDKNGRFGIGTASPANMLHIVNQFAATQGNALIMDTPSAGQQALLGFWSAGVQKWQFGKNADDSFSIWDQAGTKLLMKGVSNGNLLLVPGPGNVGVGGNPSQKLTVNGNVLANAYNTPSDIRLKENITPIPNALEKIEQLNGVYFNWKESYKERMNLQTDSRQVGVIAQDVEKVLPEIVTGTEQLSIDYTKLVPVLIQAIKEQHEHYKNENEKLHERIAILERTVKQFAAS
jgi:hypothetical protein